MGLAKFVRPRKQVTAMRATESGKPDDWDAPSHSIHGDSSPSNKELMDRKKPKRPVGPESVNSTTSNYEERKAPAGNEYRLRSYGDD
jgi:hypothetical protein